MPVKPWGTNPSRPSAAAAHARHGARLTRAPAGRAAHVDGGRFGLTLRRRRDDRSGIAQGHVFKIGES